MWLFSADTIPVAGQPPAKGVTPGMNVRLTRQGSGAYQTPLLAGILPLWRLHEAHLSTQPARSQAASRLSAPHGNHGRPQSAGPPPREGAQAPFRVRRGRRLALPPLVTLKRRPEFLAVNAGARAAKPGFVLLGLPRPTDTGRVASDAIRCGLTVTKKIGNAVQRNRARRRLRALARAHIPTSGQPGWDYVLIARDGALSRDFVQLEADLESALEMLHKARRPSKRREDGP